MSQYGLLGKAALTSGAHTTLFAVPATGVNSATANVNFVNTGTSDALIRLAVATTATPTSADYVEYDFQLGPSEVLERTGLVCSPNERIIAYANVAGVTVRAHGFCE